MKRAGGYTLIEMMIVVALVGITVASHGSLALAHRKAGLAELQRAQAMELLEYHAERLASGKEPDPATVRRLEEGLPGVKAAWLSSGRVGTVWVRFRPAAGTAFQESLQVFLPEGK